MPKVDGPIWNTDQTIVPGSASTSAWPCLKKSATADSFPAAASSLTYNPT